jgi:hypothetical protein
MPKKRSILIYGLGVVLRRFPALLWTYAFGLVLAVAFSYPLKVELERMLDSSLAAQRLVSGFDIGTAVDAALRLHEGEGGQATTMISHGAIPAYLLIYFLLVPGTLYCYITRSRARLSTLLRQGVIYFWQFVRITLLTLLAFLVIVGPVAVVQAHWSSFIDERFVGRSGLALRLCGIVVVLLVASLVRLYFDLVEAYTVQLGAERRADGKQDRRVRRTLGPAFRLLRDHLWRVWSVFLLLAVIGFVGAFLASRIAMHMLARPHVWPMFAVAQAGVLLMLLTRFWQRGAESSLVHQHPLPFLRESSRIPFINHKKPSQAPALVEDQPHHIPMIYSSDPLAPIYPAPLSAEDTLTRIVTEETEMPPDPIPDPEPAVPSLDEPDPGVFHHEPRKPEA